MREHPPRVTKIKEDRTQNHVPEKLMKESPESWKIQSCRKIQIEIEEPWCNELVEIVNSKGKQDLLCLKLKSLGTHERRG